MFGATGLAINAVYSASGDICDEFHESPNTPLGWSLVIATAVAMAAVGWRLRPRHWILLTGVVIVLHVMVYAWWITPTGTCG